MIIPGTSRTLNGIKDEVTESIKKMLDEPIAECSKNGLHPFYASNKPPAVKKIPSAFLILLYFNTL